MWPTNNKETCHMTHIETSRDDNNKKHQVVSDAEPEINKTIENIIKFIINLSLYFD